MDIAMQAKLLKALRSRRCGASAAGRTSLTHIVCTQKGEPELGRREGAVG